MALIFILIALIAAIPFLALFGLFHDPDGGVLPGMER